MELFQFSPTLCHPQRGHHRSGEGRCARLRWVSHGKHGCVPAQQRRQRALRGGGRRPGSAPSSPGWADPPAPRGPALGPACPGPPPPSLRSGPSPYAAETPAPGPRLPGYRPSAAGAEAQLAPPHLPSARRRPASPSDGGHPGRSILRRQRHPQAAERSLGAAPYPGDRDSPTFRPLIGSAQSPLASRRGLGVTTQSQEDILPPARESDDYNPQHAFRRAGKGRNAPPSGALNQSDSVA